MAYEHVPFLMMCFPIALFVSFLVLPDTPFSLMMKKKPVAAEKSLKFYLNCYDTSSEENQKRFDEGMETLNKMMEASKNTKEKITWQDYGESFHIY